MFTCSSIDDHCAFVIHTDDVVAPRLRKLILGIRRSAKKWLVIMVWFNDLQQDTMCE
jgi:hypothetical protein